jgi:hypothetical protein
LSKKKSCSPAVKMNSPPQSAQVNNRSTNSIAASPDLRDRLKTHGIPCRFPVSNHPAVVMVRMPGGTAIGRKQCNSTAAKHGCLLLFARSTAGVYRLHLLESHLSLVTSERWPFSVERLF